MNKSESDIDWKRFKTAMFIGFTGAVVVGIGAIFLPNEIIIGIGIGLVLAIWGICIFEVMVN